MPHDRKGQRLQEGDLVMIPARVTAVSMSDDFCNVTLESIEPMYPGVHRTMFSLNAKQVERVSVQTTIVYAESSNDALVSTDEGTE